MEYSQLKFVRHSSVNEILKIRSFELNATSGKQGFRTKDLHVIPAEILNGHNTILIDNIASEDVKPGILHTLRF
jgi:hypothetical protein